MATASYRQRREQIETYFDRTAAATWARLTSDAPLGRIRASVRTGRDMMRATLLNMLPSDLRDRRVLDAGCGTGALAIEAARRGAHVTAIDLSSQLIQLARQRAPAELSHGSVHFVVGDMRAADAGRFDHVVAMDSLIHYGIADAVRLLGEFAAIADHSLLFTVAPRTPALAAMHAVGRLFPRGNRAPAIEPIDLDSLHSRLTSEPALGDWQRGQTTRISNGFYTSQAVELVRS